MIIHINYHLPYLADMWQTKIDIAESRNQFDFTSKIFGLGSCFADEIGQCLNERFFDCLVNPTGVMYNPVSIAHCFRILCGDIPWQADNRFFYNGKWRHFDFHSRVAYASEDDFMHEIQNRIQKSVKHICEANLILVTLGSAFVWEHTKHGIVGNCHTLPSAEFRRRLLSDKEIMDSLQLISTTRDKLNPDAAIVLTVSPIRHKRDGLVDSSWSKARLMDCARKFTHVNNSVEYFPSYEIVMDELRDYRFYNADMIHPNKTTTKYIFNRFIDTYFNTIPVPAMKIIEKLVSMNNHRSMTTSNSGQRTAEKFTNLLDQLKNEFAIDLRQRVDQSRLEM